MPAAGIVQLTILSDGDRTVVEAALHTYRNPSVTATGSSGREPVDKSDPHVGENLAVARALRSIANRLERQAQGYLRHAESNKAHKEEIAAKKGKLTADARTAFLKRAGDPASYTRAGAKDWNERKGFPPGTFVPREAGPAGDSDSLPG